MSRRWSRSFPVGMSLPRVSRRWPRKPWPRAVRAARWSSQVGDATFEHLDPTLRERLLGNAEVFSSMELGPFINYVPDASALRQASVPVTALAGIDHRGVDGGPGSYHYE